MLGAAFILHPFPSCPGQGRVRLSHQGPLSPGHRTWATGAGEPAGATRTRRQLLSRAAAALALRPCPAAFATPRLMTRGEPSRNGAGCPKTWTRCWEVRRHRRLCHGPPSRFSSTKGGTWCRPVVVVVSFTGVLTMSAAPDKVIACQGQVASPASVQPPPWGSHICSPWATTAARTGTSCSVSSSWMKNGFQRRELVSAP